MVSSTAATVEEYIDSLAPDRAETVRAVRRAILDNLPVGYVETMQYGMMAYVIPLERYPHTYNKQPLAPTCLASQKNYLSLYLHSIYMDEAMETWFRAKWEAFGKRLNMGKSCIRFRRIDDLPLDLVGETVARVTVEEFIRGYEACRRR